MSLVLRMLAALIALSVPAVCNAAWHEAKSRHFIIYADLKPDQIRQYADRLERFDQAVRLVREMGDPKLTDAQRLRVYVLRSDRAVARLAGMRSVAGFYRPDVSGSAMFVPYSAGSQHIDWDLDAGQVFFHEYAHHLQLDATSAALPSWIVEGFAEFFATAEIGPDGSVVIGNAPQYRAYSIFNETGLRLDQIVGATHGKLDPAQRDLLYGMGWMLTHYLTFEPSRKGQLKRYIAAIQNGTSPLDAARSAFGDLATLDRQLAKYKRAKLTGFKVRGDAISVGEIAVRQLGAGEAAIMSVHIKSRRGVNRKTAPPVVVEARRAAAPFPADPFVQAALAEAEYDAGNYAAAEAAADRALAADPNYVRGLVYKGRARMELAKGNPGADWKEVRSWFSKANRLDTENAEPLMLYYRTFVEAGTTPPKIAVEGLLYSVALAPRDNGLRVNAVRQLLIDGRLEEARSLFAPLAFQPHAPERFRESNAQVMASISAGDGKRALSVLETAMELPEDDDKRR